MTRKHQGLKRQDAIAKLDRSSRKEQRNREIINPNPLTRENVDLRNDCNYSFIVVVTWSIPLTMPWVSPCSAYNQSCIVIHLSVYSFVSVCPSVCSSVCVLVSALILVSVLSYSCSVDIPHSPGYHTTFPEESKQ